MVALVEGDNPSSGDSGLDGPFEFRGPEVRSRDIFDRLDSALRWDETIRRDAQSGGGGCFPGGIDSAGRQATHVREQLAFSDSGISDHQHVQVPPDPPSVRHHLRHAAEQLESEGLFLHVHPIHGRSNRGGNHPKDVRTRPRLADESCVLFRHLDLFEFHLLLLDGVDVHEDVEESRLRSRASLLNAPQNPAHHDPLPWCDVAGEIVLDVQRQALRLLPAAQAFRRLLNLELLRVEIEGGLREELELRRTRGSLAAALFLVALERFAEVLSILGFLDDRAAPEALEERIRNPRTDFRGLADESLDGDILSEVLRAKVADWNPAVPRQRAHSEMDESRLLSWRDESPDRLLPGIQDIQWVPQKVDCHVCVESVQLVEGDREAPFLRVPVGHRDDFREIPHLLEEFLPLRDQLILWELNEHVSPPARRRRSIGNGHMVLSPPSTGPFRTREFRSRHFHWNVWLSSVTRTANNRNRGTPRSR